MSCSLAWSNIFFFSKKEVLFFLCISLYPNPFVIIFFFRGRLKRSKVTLVNNLSFTYHFLLFVWNIWENGRPFFFPGRLIRWATWGGTFFCVCAVPNQQRTLNKLPPELRCRNFVTKHRLSMQIGTKGVWNVYMFHFACHRWWLGRGIESSSMQVKGHFLIHVVLVYDCCVFVFVFSLFYLRRSPQRSTGVQSRSCSSHDHLVTWSPRVTRYDQGWSRMTKDDQG